MFAQPNLDYTNPNSLQGSKTKSRRKNKSSFVLPTIKQPESQSLALDK